MKEPSGIRKFVLNASERTELWLVLFLAFGPSIYTSLAVTFTDGHGIRSDMSFFANAASELAVLGLIVWISRIRGWSIRELGLHPSWRLTLMGLLLYAGTFVVIATFITAMGSFAPSFFNRPPLVSTVGVSVPAIVAISLINPLFEETLVCGYVIQRLAKKGATVAIVFSTLVRFLYHTYQGPFSVVALLIGFIFGYLFWRYRELWPLIVAHFLMDFLSLLLLAGKI